MTFVEYKWPAVYEHIPVDHGYLLYSALSHALQPLHEGSWQVCPMTGRPDGKWLRGPGELRIRGPLAPVMLGALNGTDLRVGAKAVKLGRATVAEVKPASRLTARFVTIKNADTEDKLLAQVVERVHALIEHIPEITIGRRRVTTIAGRKVVGFGVTISGLDDADSLAIQAAGFGGRRRMGGGVFESDDEARGIAGRWFFTPHAVTKLIERHGHTLGVKTYAEARDWMVADSASAVKAHDARGGGEVWVGRRPWRIRYVIGEPSAGVRDPLPAVITVMSNERRTTP